MSEEKKLSGASQAKSEGLVLALHGATEAKRVREGDLQVSPYSEYQPGDPGFVVEMAGYWNGGDISWAIPAWDEAGSNDLGGVFATRTLAERAMRL